MFLHFLSKVRNGVPFWCSTSEMWQTKVFYNYSVYYTTIRHSLLQTKVYYSSHDQSVVITRTYSTMHFTVYAILLSAKIIIIFLTWYSEPNWQGFSKTFWRLIICVILHTNNDSLQMGKSSLCKSVPQDMLYIL